MKEIDQITSLETSWNSETVANYSVLPLFYWPWIFSVVNSTSRTLEDNIAFWEGGASLEDWDIILWVGVPPHTLPQNTGTE